MKQLILKSRGFTLVEVLLSITILGMVILVAGSVLANHAGHTRMAEEKLSGIQLANSILRAYQKKSFSEIEAKVGTTETVDIKSLLGTDAAEVSYFTAMATISKPADSRLSNRLLLVKITVKSSRDQQTDEVEGYVKQ
ncbi:PulJ/GspJ family protein [Heyndrickxia acidiproducens]|jgi:prepilin-type N-terminal cleavage/methylation domain-containing protein|uniref:PulJ/GspJ family protein n=1 Tax=Heyndrickxia acidiproducens TaxID=1121084 RepID=UPI00035C54FD|nr:type II secretion system protein [Heyndrickxia acidiproducens]